MRMPDTMEWIVLVCCVGLGLTWTLLALAAAFSLNVAPAADPLGVLRAVLLWPVEATLLLGAALENAGLYHSTDILGLALAVGLGGGLLAGLALVLAARRYDLL